MRDSLPVSRSRAAGRDHLADPAEPRLAVRLLVARGDEPAVLLPGPFRDDDEREMLPPLLALRTFAQTLS